MYRSHSHDLCTMKKLILFLWVDHAGVTPVFPAFMPFSHGILNHFRIAGSTKPQ